VEDHFLRGLMELYGQLATEKSETERSSLITRIHSGW